MWKPKANKRLVLNEIIRRTAHSGPSIPVVQSDSASQPALRWDCLHTLPNQAGLYPGTSCKSVAAASQTHRKTALLRKIVLGRNGHRPMLKHNSNQNLVDRPVEQVRPLLCDIMEAEYGYGKRQLSFRSRASRIFKGKGCITVHPNGKTLALFLYGDRVYALDNRCPHMGFPAGQGLGRRWHLKLPLASRPL